MRRSAAIRKPRLSAAALTALADPTRRALFEQLVERPRSVTDAAAALPVSRPAVSQHLKVLKAAQLVIEERRGTRRIYRADPVALGELRSYVDRLWRDALEQRAATAAKRRSR